MVEGMAKTREEKIKDFEQMLRNAPDFMFTQTLFKFSPFGKNKTYKLINTKQLKSHIHKGTHIILKKDLIEYLADHCDDPNPNHLGITLRGTR